MFAIILTISLLILIFGPQLWCGRTLKRYNTRIEQLPGTGGELATHLLERFQIDDVKVEIGEKNQDHYDPDAKKVRLSPDYYEGKSLTAIAIAAHEVGHAIQHHKHYGPLEIRTKTARIAMAAEKIASMLLVSFPFIALLTRMPHVGILIFLCGLTILILPVLLHISTLPVEWDASFNRALPILKEGDYLPESAIPVVKKILTAAALTYVAGSLVSLLNFYRWITILRR